MFRAIVSVIITTLLSVATYAKQSTFTVGTPASSTFGVRVDYPLSGRPVDARIVDINNDSQPDQIVTIEDSSQLAIIRNLGNRQFALDTIYFLPDALLSICPSDLNGDGFCDLVVGKKILLNDGFGRYVFGANLSVNLSGICSGRFDLDSTTDLVGILPNGHLGVLLGIGNGTFSTPISSSFVGSSCDLCVVDFDNDNFDDVVVLNPDSNSVAVFHGDRNGGFDRHFTSAVGQLPLDLCAADFDGDGFKDIAVVCYGAGSLSILSNMGGLKLGHDRPDIFLSFLSSVSAADFDLDGRIDIVAGRFDVNSVWSFHNDGDWFSFVTADSVGQAPYPTYAADVDSDGVQDFFSVNQSGHSITVLYGEGQFRGLPSIQSLTVEGLHRNMHALDLRPTFEWKYGEGIGGAQRAIEIEVGTDMNWQNAELWQSGVMMLPDTFLVYSGDSLQQGHSYYARLRANDGTNWSTWYNCKFGLDGAPSTPFPYSPIGGPIADTLPEFAVVNSFDPESDTVTYDFRLSNDSALSNIIDSMNDVIQMDDLTLWQRFQALGDNQRYWWQARASDRLLKSEWTQPVAFFIDRSPDKPSAPLQLEPVTGSSAIVYELLPRFRWSKSMDPDPLDSVRYVLTISTVAAPSATIQIALDSNSYVLTDSLELGREYEWKVKAIDKTAQSTDSPTYAYFWTWELGDIDNSHTCDIADLTLLIDHLYISFTPITPLKLADLDGDCRVDISDLTQLIDRLYITFAPLEVGCE